MQAGLAKLLQRAAIWLRRGPRISWPAITHGSNKRRSGTQAKYSTHAPDRFPGVSSASPQAPDARFLDQPQHTCTVPKVPNCPLHQPACLLQCWPACAPTSKCGGRLTPRWLRYSFVDFCLLTNSPSGIVQQPPFSAPSTSTTKLVCAPSILTLFVCFCCINDDYSFPCPVCRCLDCDDWRDSLVATCPAYSDPRYRPIRTDSIHLVHVSQSVFRPCKRPIELIDT